MKNLVLWALLLLILSCSSPSQKEVFILSANQGWVFSPGDSLLWAQPGFNDSSWVKIDITRPWEDQGFKEYDGFGWYRQQIDIPASFEKQMNKNGGLLITFENADDADQCYFNGTLVGSTGEMPPEYVSKYGVKRKYQVAPELVKPGVKNLIAVRVYDGGGGGGLISQSFTIYPMSDVFKLPLEVKINDEDWVFSGEPAAEIGISVNNPLAGTVKTEIKLKVTTDDFQPVSELYQATRINPGETKQVPFRLNFPGPGFYRCTAWAEKDGIKGEDIKFNVGYEPEKIVSPVDAQPDLGEFWKITRAELDKIPPKYELKLLKDKSTGARNLYHVKMQSFGNVTIEGYYAAPKAPGKYPAIIGYMGYGSDPWMPGSDNNPDFAEFVLSVRGQGIQKATNTYGDWIVHGLDSKENYYYRGAFMDLVRAVDFVASRPEVNAEKIVAEGGSQGGAFTMVACALDHRIKAAAPTIPFLSDYPDYFKIAPWPASAFTGYLKEHTDLSWDTLYKLLSYFDVKNLAPWIQCPILMAVGLQDNVCPPHTNFSGYNLITSEKKYFVFRDQGHSVPDKWYQIRMDFFKEKLGLK
jgi:cephalosporin-C deacetylase